MNVYINGNSYTLIETPIINDNTVEIHFKEFSSDIDFSNGFYLYSGTFDNIIQDCSDYVTKWNILSNIKDGIVLTNTSEVETEDNRWQPCIIPEPEPIVPSLEERIRDLEAAVCELAEEQFAEEE